MKQTTINASLFPDGGAPPNEHVETVAPTTGPDGKPVMGLDEDQIEAMAADGKIIIVDWEPNDPENPMNWSKGKKWLTTSLLCAMTLFIGLATAAFSVGVSALSQEFGVADVVGQVGMFVFNAAFAFIPLFFAPLSESIGRNPVYLYSYACFTLFFLPLALGKNIQTIIIGRFFSGVFGAAGTTMVGGGLADIWVTAERSVPMAVFSFMAVFGTVAAPLYSGFILQNKGWRWIQWVQLIINGAVCIIEFALLRETRGSVLLARRAKKLRKETGDNRYRAASELERESYKLVLKESCTKSIKLLFTEPVVLFFSIWISFAWGIIFLDFSVIPLVFQGIYGFGTGTGGLAYIPLIIGCFIGFGGNFVQDYLYDRATERNGGVERPEARLYSAMVGAVIFPVGLWWFSWTSFANIHWIVPMIALVFVIVGIYNIFLATYNYLTDAYGTNASSAVSAQGFMRNMFAASFPLFGSQMFRGMGYQYAGTLLAALGTIAIPFPFILYKYGPTIRARSKFAETESDRAAKMADKGEKSAAANGMPRRRPSHDSSDATRASDERTAVTSRVNSADAERERVKVANKV